MDNNTTQETAPNGTPDGGIRGLIRQVLDEFAALQQAKAEPAHRAELMEERKKREQLEQRVNQLLEENRKSRARAEEAETAATIRAELQRLGVTKLDLAFKAVKDDVFRAEAGQLLGRSESGEVSIREYLAQFVKDNPELLPARMAGGSGASSAQRSAGAVEGAVELDKIRPGMSPEEMEQVRREIARIASQQMRGI